MLANSVTVSGFFFMPAIYHATGVQAAHINTAARAFSLKVAFTKGNNTARHER